jgi:Domain of unknown function (DUF4404)
MSRENLENALARLRLELDALGEEASSARSALRILIDEVEEELDHLETDDRAASLLLRVRHQVERFEVEHPRITGILNEIMISLSNIGI